MQRRTFLTLGAGAVLLLDGHMSGALSDVLGRRRPSGPLLADLNPSRQWPVYRRYRLLVLGNREDTSGMELARAVAETLARFLPDSRARASRAPHARRVGVLIATDQFDVAIMSKENAQALLSGNPPFSDLGGVPLRAIVSFDGHLLICRPDFLPRHAYLVAKTLVEHADALPSRPGEPDGDVRAHQGARAFFAGEKVPDE